MGKVATVFKVYAEDISMTDSIKADISNTLKPNGIQIDDIGFGIKVLKVMFIHEDQEGSTSFEEGLRKVKGVRDVEVEDETLI
jgi:translation elongation factor EF-1beta